MEPKTLVPRHESDLAGIYLHPRRPATWSPKPWFYLMNLILLDLGNCVFEVRHLIKQNRVTAWQEVMIQRRDSLTAEAAKALPQP